MGLASEIWQTEGFQNEGWCVLCPASVSFQELETTAEGVRMKSVVRIAVCMSLVRFATQHSRSLSESEKRLCSVQYQRHRSDDFPRLCWTFAAQHVLLISRHRQMPLMMRGRKRSLVRTHEAQEIQAAEARFGHNDLKRHHFLDLTWFFQVVLCELMMNCQYKKRKRHVLTFHILQQLDRLHLTFLLNLSKLKIHHRQCPHVVSR